MSKGNKRYRVEEQVGHLIRLAHQRGTAIFGEIMEDGGLTPRQFAALVKLHDEGELSQNYLGRLAAMDPATTKGVVQRLKAKGLIDGRPDALDRRRTTLRLTPAGAHLIATLIARGPDVTKAILMPLNSRERETLLALLKRIA